MRVTTWNCSPGKDVDRLLELLAPLGADLVTLQECHRPHGESTSVIWGGTNPRQGVAVVSTQAGQRLESIKIPDLYPTVVPVLVQAPEPFVFVGVWTHPDYNKVAWTAMSACFAEANRRGLPLVAAGDFNSSPRVIGQERSSPSLHKRMRDELGLISAYHHLSGEDLGAEKLATYYFRWKDSAPFHLDYCFVPKEWVGRIAKVDVGTFAAWPQSDHRPLTVDLKD